MKMTRRSRSISVNGSHVVKSSPEEALARIVSHLMRLNRRFALVGGLAVSVRSEVRFTRDVDLAVDVSSDDDTEQLVRDLRDVGYGVLALVEHETKARLATVRLSSPSGIVVDLIVSNCGIEGETIERSTLVGFGEVGEIPVALPEDLVAMKVLSMTESRLQDLLDAQNLLLTNISLNIELVRKNLELITERGFHRDQDLLRKLDHLLENLPDSTTR